MHTYFKNLIAMLEQKRDMAREAVTQKVLGVDEYARLVGQAQAYNDMLVQAEADYDDWQRSN